MTQNFDKEKAEILELLKAEFRYALNNDDRKYAAAIAREILERGREQARPQE